MVGISRKTTSILGSSPVLCPVIVQKDLAFTYPDLPFWELLSLLESARLEASRFRVPWRHGEIDATIG